MQKSVYLIFVGLSAYACTGTIDAEIVWLEKVSSQFQADKRTLPDADLPDQLFFHLKSKSDDLTLKLTRNHLIDPNVDIYTVRKLENGRSHLAKTLFLEKEDVAYYQDREHGAYMTARCVRRLSGQCDILINGNIQIRERNYDIQPLEADLTSRSFLDIISPRGRRYVLQDQGSIEREISVINKATRNVNGKNIEEKLKDLLTRISYGQDTIRSPKKEYYVEVLVLVDSGVFDLFLTTVKSKTPEKLHTKAKRRIREFYSHVMNGVDLLYKGINDADIAISVIVRGIHIFEKQSDFQHKNYKVLQVNKETMIDVDDYLALLVQWDVFEGISLPNAYDEVFLFTKYGLYRDNNTNVSIAGYAYPYQICNVGRRVGIIRSQDYFLTVFTAAHELGHSLGAVHDGDGDAGSCDPDDLFIMTPYAPEFNISEEYSRNPWIFSNCSVETFKKTMKDRECLKTKGDYTDKELTEWTTLMRKLPGKMFTPNQQCHLYNGVNSTYCGKVTSMICRFMYCTDPETGECMEKNFSSATGTGCGANMVQIVVCHTHPRSKLEKLQDYRVV